MCGYKAEVGNIDTAFETYGDKEEEKLHSLNGKLH